jgi:hypothetical protein
VSAAPEIVGEEQHIWHANDDDHFSSFCWCWLTKIHNILQQVSQMILIQALSFTCNSRPEHYHTLSKGSNPPTPWQNTLPQKNSRKNTQFLQKVTKSDLNSKMRGVPWFRSVPGLPIQPAYMFNILVLRDVACIYTSSTGDGNFTR